MRTYDQVIADIDTAGHPFSNHSEYDNWADRFCYRCVHDNEQARQYCPILSAAVGGEGWPTEWTRRRAGTEPTTFEVVDTCTEFEERRRGGGPKPPVPPKPRVEVDGQLDIIDAYLDTAINELTTEPATAVTA